MTTKQVLSTKDLMDLFGTSYMTVYNWRMGRGSGARVPLPFHTKPRGSRNGVFFKLREVLTWAKETGIRIKNPETRALVLPLKRHLLQVGVDPKMDLVTRRE